MKTTKASTNATTYGEYLEQREKELQEDVKFWHRAWKDTRAENAALKARIAELEAKNDNIKNDYFNLHDYALELEDREMHLENLLKHAREDVAELEAERDKLEVEEEDMKTWRKVLARQAHYTDAAWDK